MNDFHDPDLEAFDISPAGGTRRASERHRRPPGRWRSSLVLVAAVVAAFVAGPSVASHLASDGTGSAGTYPGPVAEDQLPVPTTPDNANRREGRTVEPTPTSTGDNANQREGRTAFPTPTSTGDNANQREGRTVEPTPTSTGDNANQREGRTMEPDCP